MASRTRSSFSRQACSLLLLTLSLLAPACLALRLIESKSLSPCMANSSFSASLFDVVFTPDNQTLTFNVVGVSDIGGNVTAEIQVFAYGYLALRQKIDPCKAGPDFEGLCPLNQGQINLNSNLKLGADAIKQIPGIAYTVPDLDGIVRIYINETSTGKSLACLETELSNGKTVYQKAVVWSVAVIAGLGLVASAISSGLGHSNTAAHVAANAMSLFGYFQAQAIVGMTAVNLPPIVAAWTQNFQWSMGIIRVGFLQRFCTWYQRATGGTPSNLLSSLATTSVRVQKRSLEAVEAATLLAYHQLAKRTNNEGQQSTESNSVVVVHGIKRVGFVARIESSNIFMTSYTFFIIFVLLIALGIFLFKAVCDVMAKNGRLGGDKFQDFRNGWTTVLKGILFRIALIGYTQMCVLSFWELRAHDSAAEIVLAFATLLTMIFVLGWAASKVIRIARKSIQMHRNPAYILYSDPVSLNKWGFLYVQFKASSYYFIVPILVYLMIKGIFVGLVQGSGTAQAVALVILELSMLIAVTVLRPYMDKKTNAFNISIASVNFIGAVFLLMFTNVFNQPGLVTGVLGWVYFLLNAIFALILLLMVLVSSIYAVVSKNPDARYQPMRDDRGSFIKSQTALNTELDALAVTARGDGMTTYKSRTIDDDDESFSSESVSQQKEGHRPLSNVGSPGPDRRHDVDTSYREPPRSPIDPSVPLFPGNGSASTGRAAPPQEYYGSPRYGNVGYGGHAGFNDGGGGGGGGSSGGYGRAQHLRPDARYRQQHSGSPWQQGAGYE